MRLKLLLLIINLLNTDVLTSTPIIFLGPNRLVFMELYLHLDAPGYLINVEYVVLGRYRLVHLGHYFTTLF
jgi:hypothetical protein